MRARSAASILTLAVGIATACQKPTDVAVPDGPPKKKSAPIKGARVPKLHRDKHVDCSAADTPPKTTVPFKPQPPIPPGPPCTSKSDCTEKSFGRCSAGHCTYDSCYRDSDCKAGVCTCEEQGKRGYYCKPGSCAVDGDCGDDGYCSPTWELGCGSYLGVIGWYCHAPADECTNDDECTEQPNGYCAWSPEKKHWVCGYGMCEG